MLTWLNAYRYTLEEFIAGCDEVGRGCLAGPLVAAAVILPSDFYHPLLKDSKQLSAKQRSGLYGLLRETALDWAIGLVTVEELDRINVLHASHLAMHRAVDRLSWRPDILLVDGNQFQAHPSIRHRCIVRGDEQIGSIAAASILAKVYRDQYMEALSMHIPGYRWECNMGYPTKDHRKAIAELGITKHHRKSFYPVARYLQPTFADL